MQFPAIPTDMVGRDQYEQSHTRHVFISCDIPRDTCVCVREAYVGPLKRRRVDTARTKKKKNRDPSKKNWTTSKIIFLLPTDGCRERRISCSILVTILSFLENSVCFCIRAITFPGPYTLHDLTFGILFVLFFCPLITFSISSLSLPNFEPTHSSFQPPQPRQDTTHNPQTCRRQSGKHRRCA